MYFFLSKPTCFLCRYFEALTRFQHVLTVSGINKALKEQGVAEGDTVIIGEVNLVFLLKVLCNAHLSLRFPEHLIGVLLWVQMELIWNDSEDIRATHWKRGFRGSRLWPH